MSRLTDDETLALLLYGQKTCGLCKQTKPFAEFDKNRRGTLGLQTYCKPCSKIKWKESRDRIPKEIAQLRRLKAKGVVIDSDDVYRVAFPTGNCAVCQHSTKKLVFDHDHKTGKFRDVLCHKCNILVGCLELDPTIVQAARDYISRWTANGLTA